MKTFLRIICVLIVALSGGCGGGGGGSAAATPAATADTRLVMDTMAWDQGDWSD